MFINVILYLFLFFSFFVTCKKQESQKIPPKAVKGVLDLRSVETFRETSLRGWDFAIDGTIYLDGEWEFYWQEFLEPANTNAVIPVGDAYTRHLQGNDSTIQNYIPVPGEWNNFLVNGETVGGKGYATYRLKVLLPKSLDSETIGIKMPNIGTAYELWAGNRLYGKAGKVSAVEEIAEAGFNPRLFWLRKDSFTEEADSKTLDIVIKVSNYHDTSGGIWYYLKFGDYQTLVAKDKQQVVIDFFLFGSILIMGLYHFGLYFLRKKDSSALWFGMYCIAINWRILVTGEKYLEFFFPDSHLFLRFLEYMDFVLLVPIFGKFLYSLFPEEMNSKVKNGIVWMGVAFTIPILFFPPFYYTKITTPLQIHIILSCIYVIYVVIQAILNKRMGAKIFLAGFVFFFLIIVHDILYFHSILQTLPLSSLGLFGFIFSQAAVLSMRFSKAFTQAENLSNDLEQKSNRLEETSLELFTLTQNLEIKIQERTKDLEETKKEIEEINSFAHIVNSLSDLNSIFIEISKYFYHRFGITGTWLFLPDEKREYLYAYKAYSYNKLSEDKYDYLKNKKIPLKEIEGGMLYLSFQRKKPFFLLKIPKFVFQIDQDIVEILEIKSLLHIPLVRKEECVGILAFSNMQEEMKLSKKEINTIVNLCSQVAAVINTNHLLQQIEKEKQKTIELNQLIKVLNELSNLEDIMQTIFLYILGKYHFPYYTIAILDARNNQLKHAHSYLPEDLSEKEVSIIKNISLSLDSSNTESLHIQAIRDRKPLYIPDAESVIKSESGKYLLSIVKQKSFVTLPIVLQNQPIGTIDLFSQDFVFLSEDDLLELSFLSEQFAGIINGSLLMNQVQEEKEKSIAAREEAEKQKRETEELNQLIKSLNEEFDLKVIMQKVFRYLNENFRIGHYGLLVVNKERTHIYVKDINFPEYINEGDRKIIQEHKYSINEKKGAHSFAFRTKKVMFIPKVKLGSGTDEENFVIEKFKHYSMALIPLFLNNEPIGCLDISNLDQKMELSKENITRLSILGEQLAGIIHGSNLFKQVQEEKEKANLAKEEADKARQETEGLNDLMRNVNSVSSLVDIMSFIMYYLETEYNFQDYYLLLNETSEEKVIPFSFTSPRNLEEARQYFLNFTIQHSELQGVIADILENKKPIFLKKEDIPEGDIIVSEWVEKGNFDYIFLLPLVIYDELIGILFLHSPEKVMIVTEEVRLKLERFSDLIAGSVFNARLLKKVEEAKEMAVIAQREADTERNKSEKLLLNILPKDVAGELKEKGFALPELFEQVSVMFTDFKGFTQIAEKLSPQELIKDLDACFVQFDKITERAGLEKLKTIGDSYMCAGGIPKRNTTHAIDCCLAALEIQAFMNMMKKLKEDMGFPYWELRLGIHSGPLVAGVIGERKFAYDVWGDTVNTASRMESSGTPGKINISYSTYELVKDLFDCEYRGEISAKNKGVVKMYYLNRIRSEFSKDKDGMIPNGKFWEMYS